jgi:hypothetical protein
MSGLEGSITFDSEVYVSFTLTLQDELGTSDTDRIG